MPTHITVTAPEGRRTPINPADGTHPNGLLWVDGPKEGKPGDVARVRYSQDVQRSIKRGDLIPCKLDGSKVDNVDQASAPAALDTGSKVSDRDIMNESGLANDAEASPRHRQIEPEKRYPLPDENGPQTEHRRKNIPPPAPHAPKGPNPTEEVPGPLETAGVAGETPTMDASKRSSFDLAHRGGAKPSKE
jgi:hypothetical protein